MPRSCNKEAARFSDAVDAYLNASTDITVELRDASCGTAAWYCDSRILDGLSGDELKAAVAQCSEASSDCGKYQANLEREIKIEQKAYNKMKSAQKNLSKCLHKKKGGK
jgi:hypothetical protein